jgi:hypothetical protein
MTDMTPVSPETMALELLPCPFCSSPRVRVYSSDWCYAECHECFARAARFGTKKKAIEAWNRRAGYSTALAAEREDWRPIETAPKDGTVILGWWPQAYQGKGGIFEYIWHKDGWYTVPCSWQHMTPTHWSPLPAPPAIRTGRSEGTP